MLKYSFCLILLLFTVISVKVHSDSKPFVGNCLRFLEVRIVSYGKSSEELFKLARFYEKELHDLKTALFLYNSAAKEGNLSAIFELERMFVEGHKEAAFMLVKIYKKRIVIGSNIQEEVDIYVNAKKMGENKIADDSYELAVARYKALIKKKEARNKTSKVARKKTPKVAENKTSKASRKKTSKKFSRLKK